MYKRVYDKGWDVIRQERFEKQKELGLIPKDTKFLPRAEDVKPWNELSETEKKIFIKFQETYAGMLTHIRPPRVRVQSFLPSICFIYSVSSLAERALFCFANSSNDT